uniref:Transposase, MuDR, MULE transposase domain protein n=1 Tax=Tanacetum cinerariifolium TaxID=118510 RepID=A0A6L2L7S8_TANCI|nr:transposase, MuDR, MULE transposase domain protein [Tanacetum cinerariifolium]
MIKPSGGMMCQGVRKEIQMKGVIATDGNGDVPGPDLRTMEEMCQPTLNGRGGPIVPIVIQEMNFGLKNDMIQQGPGENSSQSPPHIDHHCCYGCSESLDSIFCHQYTCESCGNGAHYGYNCPPKVPIISNSEPCHNQNVDEFPQTLPSFHPTCYTGDENSFAYDSTPNLVDDSPNDFNPPSQPLTNSYEFCGNGAHYGHDCPPQNRPAFYNYDDDDEDYTIAITPVLSTEEPVDSLIMKDEHLDTIPATKSDEVIKSSVKDLVPIPSESEGISNDTCDVPFCDNSQPLEISKDQFEDFSNYNDDSTSIDDNYFSIDDIDYVEASPLDSELVSLKESPSPFPIPVEDSDSFFEKSDTSLSYSDNSLPEFETFSDHTEETSSGSTTTHADNSLAEYDSFLFEIEPDQGELTSVVMEDNLGEPRVHVPNVLPTHLTLMLDSDFIPSDNSLPKYEIFCFDIEEKNSGSTTIHAGISLLDFDHFHFKIEPNPGELTSIVDSEIHENVPSATNVNLSPEDDQSPLFAYVVWIFLPFLAYLVAPPYLLSFGNEDTVFDPSISIYHSFMPGVSHRSRTFMKFNVYPNHLNESPMEILSSTCFPMDQRIRGREESCSVFGKVKRLCGEDESSDSDDESNESDEEGSESDEDAKTTPAEYKNYKEDKFWNMPPLLKTPVPNIKNLKRDFKLDTQDQTLKWIYRGKEIMTDMKARFKIDNSYPQAWRAKCYALQLLRGTPGESFAELPLYCHNLKLKNQGTITHIETDDEDSFKIFFLPSVLRKEELFWKACKAYRNSDFEERFSTLRDWLPIVANKLDMIGLEK